MLSPTEHLLKYRPWRGKFRPPAFASVAMARASLQLMFRRKLFWENATRCFKQT